MTTSDAHSDATVPRPTRTRLRERRLTRRQVAAGLPLALAAPFALTAGSSAARMAATPTGATPGAATPRAAASPLAQAQDGLLPSNRVLSYYGFPGNENMGILGEYDKDTLLAKLRDQAAGYQAADPSRPVVLAFEIVASVAQRDPGSDGLYVVHIGDDILSEYADYTAQQGIQLLLDVQFGRSTVEQEFDGFATWLEQPHIHLALDPEFAIQQGETPGVDLGSIDAAWITYAQDRLAKLAADKGIPPKILLVHQFRESMIRNKGNLKPVAGVQLVINADGFGDPDTKIEVYNILIKGEPVQYNGIKLFYQNDQPLMSPEQVLALDPVPDLVIYQ